MAKKATRTKLKRPIDKYGKYLHNSNDPHLDYMHLLNQKSSTLTLRYDESLTKLVAMTIDSPTLKKKTILQ